MVTALQARNESTSQFSQLLQEDNSYETSDLSGDQQDIEESQSGIVWRMASGTWWLMTELFRVTARCVKKVYNTTGSCIGSVYRTANGIVYIVGITTTGVLIYTWYNGEFSNKIVFVKNIAGDDALEKVQCCFETSLPFVGDVVWQVPPFIEEAFTEISNVNHELNLKAQAVVAAAEDGYRVSSDLLDSVNSNLDATGLSSFGKRVLNEVSATLTPVVENLGKALEDITA